MSETIYFNGNKYNSVTEMPLNERRLYQKMAQFMRDDNLDGVPDIVQNGGLSGLKETINMIREIVKIGSIEGLESGQISVVRETDSGIFINGKKYKNPEEMPNYVRNEYERIVDNAQIRSDDIFDESWRPVNRSEYFDPHDDEIFNRNISGRSPNAEPPIQIVDSTGRFVIAATIAILILGCMTAIWYLFF